MNMNLTNDEINYFNGKFKEKRSFWLEKVSRTFTLSINALPQDLKDFVGHAYLVCRFLDTIEDCEDMSVSDKKIALDKSIENMQDFDSIKGNLEYFIAIGQKYSFNKYEKELLLNSSEVFSCLFVFPKKARKIITKYAILMAGGMEKYAFGTDKKDFQLKTMDELEEYTYYVAGTVGELLSDLFTDNNKISKKSAMIMQKNAIAFGKALQYVNIIKDSRADIEENRCFIPLDLISKFGLNLENFFHKNNVKKAEQVYKILIKQAKEYLVSAVTYIRAIPLSQRKIRLFCIWPVLLAYKTISAVENNIPLLISNPKSLKIGRKEVKWAIINGYISSVSNTYLSHYINKIKI